MLQCEGSYIKDGFIVQRRSLISFLILNAIVTFLMASAVILVNEARQAAQPTPPGRLLQVVGS